MELTGNVFYFDWEAAVINLCQQHMGTAGTFIASVISMFGEELMCVAVMGFLYWCYDKELGRRVGMIALAGLTLNSMCKNVFVRRRPYFDHSSIQCLKPVEKNADIYDIAAQGYSFPSGHSTNAVTIYTSLGLLTRSGLLRAAGILIPLLVGISRFCLGVHYPTDVLAGWLLGLVTILLVSLLQEKVRNKWLRYLLLLVPAAAGWLYCTSDDYFTSFGILVGFILGTEFEKRFVRFENTRNPLRGILRVLGGVAIFFGLNTLLKLPFGSEFLESGTAAAHAVRAGRYALAIFADLGLYPLLFSKDASGKGRKALRASDIES